MTPETTTRLPSRASAKAVARPIPLSAPVIKTTGVLISATPFHGDDTPGLPARAETAHLWPGAGIPRIAAGAEDLGFHGGSEKDFVRSRSYLAGMASEYGAAASALSRGRRRGRKSDARSRSAAAHGTALIKPADPRPRSGSRRPTPDTEPAWDRADRGRSGVSRSR